MTKSPHFEASQVDPSTLRKLNHRQVGPRDGLQFEPVYVSPQARLKYIDQLIDSGEGFIEVASFANTNVVPAMAGADRIAAELKERVRAAREHPEIPGNEKYKDTTFSFLVMSEKNAQEALKYVDKDFGEIAVVAAASDEFCRTNMNLKGGIEEALDVTGKAAAHAKEAGVKVRGYVSTIFEGPMPKAEAANLEAGQRPFEDVDPDRVVEVTKRLFDQGCYEVSLGDTTGAGTPEKVEILLKKLKDAGVPLEKISMHFHDTNNNAIENVEKSLELGVDTFDSSSGGLGGCKFSNSPKGNLATETLELYCRRNGMTIGVDPQKMMEASHYILNEIGKQSTSLAHTLWAKKMRYPEITPKLPTRIMRDEDHSTPSLNVFIDARGVAQVAVNRQESRNAFDPALIKEITETFKKLDENPEVKAVVLSGEGKAFSAGANLKWMGEMYKYTHEENVADALNLAKMLETMHSFSKPLIGRVHGSAMGGGCGLAAVCDYTVAADDTDFAFTEAKLGLRPSTISSYCIPKLGKENALHLFQTAETFKAPAAVSYGLIDKAVPIGQLDKEVNNAIKEALSSGKQALREKSEAARTRSAVETEKPQTVNENMVALVEGVTRRLNNGTPGAREHLLAFTAEDIANARESDEARTKIKAFLDTAAAKKKAKEGEETGKSQNAR